MPAGSSPAGPPKAGRVYSRKASLRSVEERNALAEENAGLVRFVLKTSFPGTCYADAGDLVGAGMLGMLRACELYDSAAGKTFATFAYQCIWSFMRRERDKIEPRAISIPPGLSIEERAAARERLGVSALPRDESLHPAARQHDGPGEDWPDRLASAMRCLPGRTRAMVRAHVVEGLTLKAIARAHRISGKRVKLIVRKALARMRRLLRYQS